ncbi:unannotated protein [freshwater metagenome]|uniref:Unannotated protein n=1 Tax=freshwater metagenome TaxID=449393 RepID=A0A6J6LT98_9ZZZZ
MNDGTEKQTPRLSRRRKRVLLSSLAALLLLLGAGGWLVTNQGSNKADLSGASSNGNYGSTFNLVNDYPCIHSPNGQPPESNFNPQKISTPYPYRTWFGECFIKIDYSESKTGVSGTLAHCTKPSIALGTALGTYGRYKKIDSSEPDPHNCRTTLSRAVSWQPLDLELTIRFCQRGNYARLPTDLNKDNLQEGDVCLIQEHVIRARSSDLGVHSFVVDGDQIWDNPNTVGSVWETPLRATRVNGDPLCVPTDAASCRFPHLRVTYQGKPTSKGRFNYQIQFIAPKCAIGVHRVPPSYEPQVNFNQICNLG